MAEPNPISSEAREHVRKALTGLLKSLQDRKGMGAGSTGLIPDEELVYNALVHPERGDVLVTVISEPGSPFHGLDIFISNRRDPDNPFACMNAAMMRFFSGRRPLDGVALRGEDHWGLFLITVQDRETLRAHKDTKSEAFSSSFDIIERAPQQTHEKLETLSVTEMNADQKWKVLSSGSPSDPRVKKLQEEFFGVTINYAKHKQSPQNNTLILSPADYREKIGQLVRDVYPYGVRVSLRRDFPGEHKTKLAEVHGCLRELSTGIRQKADSGPPQVQDHAQRVSEYIDDILNSDPELTRIV